MCGIYGIVRRRPGPTPSVETLKRMGDLTVHRGPDDSGVFADNGLAVGMRRLSIIDLESGHQPLQTADGQLVLVCNGEIYNFRELRKELQALGHTFATNSDSEVILHAYAQWGDAFIDHVDGMFGFALVDRRRRRVIIGRDRLGIKPLYVYVDDEQVIFASEAKAILEAGVEAKIAPAALHQYLMLGYVPAPHSIFQGIDKLPVASLMFIENGEVHTRRYWDLPTRVDHSDRDWEAELVAQIRRAVREQMVSDVPLGAFLSGGVDSSAVVAFMSETSKEPVRTYSIGFDTGDASSFYNELPFAKQVADQFNTQHREILVRPDVVDLLPKLAWHLDEPIGDSAFITTFLVSEFARQDVTVILSGAGGDELFGGYRRYLGEYFNSFYQRVPSTVRQRLITPIAERLPADRHSKLLNVSRLARGFLLAADLPLDQRYASYVGVYGKDTLEQLMLQPPNPPDDALGRAFSEAHSGADDPVRALFEVDLATQLPDDILILTDKMSMATSLECRVPLLDTKLVELAARMPSKHKIRGRELKSVLKRSLHGMLPHEILYRQKRGFGAPMGSWVKNELRGLTEDLLSVDSVSRRGLFNPAMVQQTLRDHSDNKADNTDHILSLLNLEVWSRLYLDGQSAEDLTEEIRSRRS